MQQGAHIGGSVVIKGEISAQEPVTVAGRVDGSIDAPGQTVTIEAGAHVTADIAAGTIVVAGAVKGSIVAESRVALQAGSEVIGDLEAPRVSVEDGARFCGKAIVGTAREVDLARAS
jgi:cytoskeletal protein CcmA (bactofilin family)